MRWFDRHVRLGEHEREAAARRAPKSSSADTVCHASSRPRAAAGRGAAGLAQINTPLKQRPTYSLTDSVPEAPVLLGSAPDGGGSAQPQLPKCMRQNARSSPAVRPPSSCASESGPHPPSLGPLAGCRARRFAHHHQKQLCCHQTGLPKH